MAKLLDAIAFGVLITLLWSLVVPEVWALGGLKLWLYSLPPVYLVSWSTYRIVKKYIP